MLLRHRSALTIQRVWRGHCGRVWFQYHLHNRNVDRGAALINRVYRCDPSLLPCVCPGLTLPGVLSHVFPVTLSGAFDVGVCGAG